MKRQSTTAFGVGPMGAMPGEPSTTTESRSSEEDQTSTCMLNPGGVGNATACETSIWEEWTQATSTEDEVSTSNFLPELTSSTTSRLSFQQTDMMATWMSSFHPLTHCSMSPDLPPASVVVDVAASLMHEPGLALDPSAVEEDAAAQAFPVGYAKATSHRQMRRGGALGPLSPSSPLAIQNGMLNPLGDPWDSCPSTLQWSTVTTTGQPYNNNYGPSCRNASFNPDHSSTVIDHLESTGYSALSRPRHTDIFIGPNGTFESSTPGGWTPQLMYDATSETTVGSSMTPMKLMASLLEVGEATSSDVCSERKQQQQQQQHAAGPAEIGLVRDRGSRPAISQSTSQGFSTVTISSILADCKRSDEESNMATQLAWPGKHRLELVELVDGEDDMQNSSPPPLLKRLKTDSQVELAKAWQWSDQTLRGADLRSFYPSSSSLAAAASEAMQIIAIGPALNTNGKPRARRGSATDPQSVYARHRREKINERLKILQNLVPNGAKVDIVTMLDEAIHYVKFLQHQVELLKSDDDWMHATPNNYSGMDLPDLCPRSQELESSAS